MAWLASCAVPDMEPTSWLGQSDLGVLCAPATWHLAYFFSAQGLPDQRLAVARQNGELLHEEGGALVGYVARQHLPSLLASLQQLSLRQTLYPSFWDLLGAKES